MNCFSCGNPMDIVTEWDDGQRHYRCKKRHCDLFIKTETHEVRR